MPFRIVDNVGQQWAQIVKAIEIDVGLVELIPNGLVERISLILKVAHDHQTLTIMFWKCFQISPPSIERLPASRRLSFTSVDIRIPVDEVVTAILIPVGYAYGCE